MVEEQEEEWEKDVVKYGKLIGRFNKLDKEKNVFYITCNTSHPILGNC